MNSQPEAQPSSPPDYYGSTNPSVDYLDSRTAVPAWANRLEEKEEHQFLPFMMYAVILTIVGVVFYRFKPELEYLPAYALSGLVLVGGIVFASLSLLIWKRNILHRKEAEAYALKTKNEALLNSLPPVNLKHRKNIYLMLVLVYGLGAFHLGSILWTLLLQYYLYLVEGLNL